MSNSIGEYGSANTAALRLLVNYVAKKLENRELSPGDQNIETSNSILESLSGGNNNPTVNDAAKALDSLSQQLSNNIGVSSVLGSLRRNSGS